MMKKLNVFCLGSVLLPSFWIRMSFKQLDCWSHGLLFPETQCFPLFFLEIGPLHFRFEIGLYSLSLGK